MLKSKLMKTMAALGTAAMIVSGTGVTAFAAQFDPAYYAATNPDVAAAVGNNAQALLNHYVTCGQKEGRRPSASAQPGEAVTSVANTNVNTAAATQFDPAYYAATYPDVATAVGNNAQALLNHYVTCGQKEGRKPNANAAGGAAVSGMAATTPAQAVTYQSYGINELNTLRAKKALKTLAYDAKLDTVSTSLNAQFMNGSSEAQLKASLRKMNQSTTMRYKNVGFATCSVKKEYASILDDNSLAILTADALFTKAPQSTQSNLFNIGGMNITRAADGVAYVTFVFVGN